MKRIKFSSPRRGQADIGVGCALVLVVGILIVGAMVALPSYNVWSSRKAGEAQLAQAESNRQITVLEAKAKLDSAKNLADAEVAKARGVAEANKIIGTSLKDNEAYLRWRWIENMTSANKEVVYIPTEGNMPIMEAQRLAPKPPPPVAPPAQD